MFINTDPGSPDWLACWGWRCGGGPILVKMVSTCSLPLNSFQKLWTSNNIPIAVSYVLSRYAHPPVSLNWETDRSLASSNALLNSSEKAQVLPKRFWSDCEERSSTKLKIRFCKMEGLDVHNENIGRASSRWPMKLDEFRTGVTVGDKCSQTSIKSSRLG